jgi:hypothetical protein
LRLIRHEHAVGVAMTGHRKAHSAIDAPRP